MSVSNVRSQSRSPKNRDSVIEGHVEFRMGPASTTRRSLSRYYKSKSRSFFNFSSIASQFGDSAQALGKKRTKSADEVTDVLDSNNNRTQNQRNKTSNFASFFEETRLIFHDLKLDAQKLSSERRVRRRVDTFLPFTEI